MAKVLRKSWGVTCLRRPAVLRMVVRPFRTVSLCMGLSDQRLSGSMTWGLTSLWAGKSQGPGGFATTQ